MIIKPIMTKSDDALMTLIKQGDREAFNILYKRYWQRLYKEAFYRIKSSGEAEDLVQDLFIDFWLKREMVSIQTSLEAYFFTAIKYKVINHIEANIVKRNYLRTLEKAALEIDNGTIEGMTCRDTEHWIREGTKKLSPKVREVFELSRNGHLSISEISSKLNISAQTVKNQISKALKVLKGHLNDSPLGMFLIIAVILILFD